MPGFFSRMLSLLPKVTSKIESARTKSDEEFSVFEGEMDGRPLVAMINMALRDYECKTAVPWFLGLSTSIINPTESGLPTSEESIALDNFEALVEKRIGPVCHFVYVGRVTWSGSREILYYVDRPEPVTSILKKLGNDPVTRRFAFSCVRDDEWVNVAIYFRQSKRSSC